MEPLNAAERRKAFSNYLLFFIITIAIVVAAVFFWIQVPFQQNKQLTEQMKLVEAQRLFTQKFESNMNEVMRLFNELKKKEVDATLTDGKIEERIKAMNALIESDSSFAADPNASVVKGLSVSVVASLSELRTATREITNATNKDENLSELKQEINNLRSELTSAKQEAAMYKILAAKSSSN